MTQSEVSNRRKNQFWIVLFGVFIFANAGDFITTKTALDLVAHEAELNPLLRVLMASFGIYALLAMKSLACGVVWLFRRKINNRTLQAANIAFSALAVNNAIQIYSIT